VEALREREREKEIMCELAVTDQGGPPLAYLLTGRDGATFLQYTKE